MSIELTENICLQDELPIVLISTMEKKTFIKGYQWIPKEDKSSVKWTVLGHPRSKPNKQFSQPNRSRTFTQNLITTIIKNPNKNQTPLK